MRSACDLIPVLEITTYAAMFQLSLISLFNSVIAKLDIAINVEGL